MIRTICLVDDNEDIIEIFSIFFRKQGYNVLVASDGQACIENIRRTPPDIILLDVMMEPMDGWQTLEQIKKDPLTSDIPVIMVSGKRLTLDEIENYGELFVKYIMKPVSLPVLNDTVSTVLEHCPRISP